MRPEMIAAKRGWQTLADGAIVVAIVAGLIPLIAAIQGADSWASWIAGWQVWLWQAWQGAVIAGGTALVAYVRRRWVHPPETDEPRRAAPEPESEL